MKKFNHEWTLIDTNLFLCMPIYSCPFVVCNSFCNYEQLEVWSKKVVTVNLEPNNLSSNGF